MGRRFLFWLATWRDPRNRVLICDEDEALDMRNFPSIEGNIKMEKALAALRYIRELSA